MRIYLDSSVAIHVLDADAGGDWFDAVCNAPTDSLVSSRLIQTEICRYLVRTDVPLSEHRSITDYVEQLPVTERIMAIADMLAPKLKAADAIHVASAIVSGATAIATHDRQMKAAAEIVALEVIDPISR